MFKLINFRSPNLLALSLLLSSLPAMAQFEVSPDHFDSPTAKPVAHRRAAAKVKAKTAPATGTTVAAAQQKSSMRKNQSAAASRTARQETTAAMGPR